MCFSDNDVNQFEKNINNNDLNQVQRNISDTQLDINEIPIIIEAEDNVIPTKDDIPVDNCSKF